MTAKRRRRSSGGAETALQHASLPPKKTFDKTAKAENPTPDLHERLLSQSVSAPKSTTETWIGSAGFITDVTSFSFRFVLVFLSVFFFFFFFVETVALDQQKTVLPQKNPFLLSWMKDTRPVGHMFVNYIPPWPKKEFNWVLFMQFTRQLFSCHSPQIWFGAESHFCQVLRINSQATWNIDSQLKVTI